MVEVSYIGETSRPLRERVWEHNQNLRNGSTKSFILSHWMDAHSGSNEPPEFKWTIMDSYTDALRRQLAEGLLILKSGVLNKKLEFNNNLICRMEARTNGALSEKELQKELSERKAYNEKLKNFICDKASASDVFNLKK